MGFEISCYNDAGVIVSGTLPSSPQVDHQVAKHSAVHDWIAKKGKMANSKHYNLFQSF